jgi:hypothetical protein
MYNPYIQGWINYYGNFYRTQLRPTLKRIDLYVIRWARRKFKRLRHQTKGARDWFARLVCANPKLFAHWQLCHGNGRTTGAVGIERFMYGCASRKGKRVQQGTNLLGQKSGAP